MSSCRFSPRDGGTVTVTASDTSADEAFVAGNYQLRILNATTAVAFVKTAAASALTATAADFPVGPGETDIITIASNHNIVAVLLSTGTGSVYITPGSGN